MSIDRDTFRAALGQWPSGVTVVTTVVDGTPHGMTASSFSSVSLDPPLVSVCVAHHVTSHDLIAKSGVFAVSILAKDQVDDGMRFAGMLGVDDRFEGVEVHTSETGAPMLGRALAWLDCRVWAQYDGGDHTIFVGEVLDAGTQDGRAPLLYHDRAWGQFADVLPEAVTVDHPAVPDDGVVLTGVFGTDGVAAEIDDVVAIVREAVQGGPAMIVLDDAGGVAHPMQVRSVLQSISTIVGRIPVAVRFGAGPFCSANLLTALKSGVKTIQAGDDCSALARDLATSLGVEVLTGTTPGETA